MKQSVKVNPKPVVIYLFILFLSACSLFDQGTESNSGYRISEVTMYDGDEEALAYKVTMEYDGEKNVSRETQNYRDGALESTIQTTFDYEDEYIKVQSSNGNEVY